MPLSVVNLINKYKLVRYHQRLRVTLPIKLSIVAGRDELRAESCLFGRWLVPKQHGIEPFDALARLRGGIDLWPSHGCRGQINDTRTVHKEQRLLRNGGRESLRAMRVGRGKVERAEKRGQILPLDLALDAAPLAEWGRTHVHGRPADRFVQLSGDEQQRIAERLQIHSLAVHSPDKHVLW